MFKISVKGSQAVINSLKRKRQGLGNTMQAVVRASGLQVEKQAKINAANTAAARQAYMARAQRTADSRDSSQGNTVTGFGKSGLGRDPNDRA